MVVQFPPADPSPGSGPGDESRRADGRPGGAAHGTTGGARQSRLAPVTYLPGARPSEAARRTLDNVNSVARDDEARPLRDRQTKRANNVAIHQLARRGMSRWELEQVLAKREVDVESAAAELDRLESIGLVDDAALAVSVVYGMHTRKGAGRSAIASELRRRHLDEAVIADALAELDGDDEQERATQLALGRAGRLTSLDLDVATRRLTGFLARKGYDSDVIRSAVRTALEGHPGDGPSGDGVRFH